MELKDKLINFINKYDNNPRVVFGTLFRKQELVDAIYVHTSYLSKSIKLAQRVHHIINGIVEPPICKVCSKNTNFRDFKNGYNIYCSTSCGNKDEYVNTKKKKTCKINYGVSNPSQSKVIQDKKKQTWLVKYGVDHPFKAKEIQEKRKQTWLNNYGVDHISKADKIKKQKIDTSQEKYGVDNISQADEIKNKKAKSLYSNGTGPCSKQQKYIYDLIGGELNYPVGNCSLDIAFPDKKIYFEYDGGGHDTQVKFGCMTQEEFDKKEVKRGMFLYRRGWKKISLTSRKDYLASDSKLIEIIDTALVYLKERSWINFDIDNGIITTSKMKEQFDFGQLIKV